MSGGKRKISDFVTNLCFVKTKRAVNYVETGTTLAVKSGRFKFVGKKNTGTRTNTNTIQVQKERNEKMV